jgi:hypothetical protein
MLHSIIIQKIKKKRSAGAFFFVLSFNYINPKKNNLMAYFNQK